MSSAQLRGLLAGLSASRRSPDVAVANLKRMFLNWFHLHQHLSLVLSFSLSPPPSIEKVACGHVGIPGFTTGLASVLKGHRA